MSEQNLIAFACLIGFITMTSAFVGLRRSFGFGAKTDPAHRRDLGPNAGKKLLDSMTAPAEREELFSDPPRAQLAYVPTVNK